MSNIKQIRYNRISCIKCGDSMTADLAAFDFGIIFSEAISEKMTHTLQSELSTSQNRMMSLWNPLINLDLCFYYTIRDICQDLGFKRSDSKPTMLVLRTRDVIRQLEFLMNGTPFDELKKSGSSVMFNNLFNVIQQRQGTTEDKEENIRLLLRYLSESPEDSVIIRVPIKIVLSKDDSNNEIANCVEYYINKKKKVLVERVCPGCGMPLDHEAGYRNEYIIGMAGISRVGKTAYIASLIEQLSKLDNTSYIHISENESESLKQFRETIISQYVRGDVIEKTEVENEKKIPLVYLPLQIGGKIVNLIFVDMPGEVYGGNQNEGLDFISNRRKVLQNADVIWCCIEPSMIDSRYVNGNVCKREETTSSQLSGLLNILRMAIPQKIPASVILTQSDLLKGDTSLFHPDVDVMSEYLLEDYSFDVNKAMLFMDETKSFVDRMINFETSAKTVFEGISMFAVSSYGYDISQKTLLSNKILRPSMIELPFLWTLASLGLLKAEIISTVKTLLGKEKTVAVEVQERSELYVK